MSRLMKNFSVLLCLVMLLCSIPTAFAAEEQTTSTQLPTCQLPEPEMEIPVIGEPSQGHPTRGITYHATEAAAVAQLRSEMEKRTETIDIGFKTATLDQEFVDYIYPALFYGAVEHTGVGTQGDYLLKHWNGYSADLDYYRSGGYYYCTFTYYMKYYTTYAQEQVLTAAIDSFMAQYIKAGMSDYEKFCTVYDWICDNVTYDYNNLNNDAYKLKYTAYAAMINKTSVCQGYASLLYRMLLQCGIDNRYISGIGNGGSHGWNIVKLDGLYYNVDSTWDAGTTTKAYCLRSDENFLNHARNAEYATADFYARYPMSPEDYGADQRFDIAFARMILGNSLEFQFAIPKSAMDDWSGTYAQFRRHAPDVTYVYTVPLSSWSTATVNGVAHWAISYNVLAAKEMADLFEVTIYNAAGEAVSNTHKDSVRAYVERAFTSQTTEGRTMMVDMLNYGAAAQKEFNYNTGDLANSKLTAAQKAYATQTTPATDNELVKDSKYKGTRLVLESRIQMQLAFSGLSTDMYAIYTYKNHTGEECSYIVYGSKFVNAGGIYGVELSNLVYADARSPVTVKVYDSKNKLVASATDSIESYINRSGNGELYSSLIKFTDSAYNYLH